MVSDSVSPGSNPGSPATNFSQNSAVFEQISRFGQARKSGTNSGYVRHKSRHSFLSVLFAGLMLLSHPVFAADFYIRTAGIETWRVPNGFAAFCDSARSDCGRPGRLDMISKAKWKDTLIEVNNRVNRETRYVDDVYLKDHWKAANGSGDCEDYAIQKRRDLIQAGVPASSMRYAFVEASEGPHIVLIVRTDDGDRVLDNTTDTIYPANKTNYIWLSVQSRWNPRKWLKVAN